MEWEEHTTSTAFLYELYNKDIKDLKIEELDFLEGMTFHTYRNSRLTKFVFATIHTNRLKAEAPTHPRIKEFEEQLTKLMLEEFIEGGVATAKVKQISALKKTSYGL
jgi:hypothetical protein